MILKNVYFGKFILFYFRYKTSFIPNNDTENKYYKIKRHSYSSKKCSEIKAKIHIYQICILRGKKNIVKIICWDNRTVKGAVVLDLLASTLKMISV